MPSDKSRWPLLWQYAGACLFLVSFRQIHAPGPLSMAPRAFVVEILHAAPLLCPSDVQLPACRTHASPQSYHGLHSQPCWTEGCHSVVGSSLLCLTMSKDGVCCQVATLCPKDDLDGAVGGHQVMCIYVLIRSCCGLPYPDQGGHIIQIWHICHPNWAGSGWVVWGGPDTSGQKCWESHAICLGLLALLKPNWASLDRPGQPVAAMGRCSHQYLLICTYVSHHVRFQSA
jgi:hypothetical protein